MPTSEVTGQANDATVVTSEETLSDLDEPLSTLEDSTHGMD